MDVLSNVMLVFSRIGKYLGLFLGGYDGPLCALLILTAANYVTSLVCVAFDRRNYEKIGVRAIFSKVLILILVGISNILDRYILGYGSCLRTAILLFYISEEGLSILENASCLGLPIPGGIKRILKNLKGDK